VTATALAPTEGVMVTSWLDTPLGPMIACATGRGVCLLEFGDRRALETQYKTLQRLFNLRLTPGRNRHITRLGQELDAYFARKCKRFTVPLEYPGTPFQRGVWEELLRIPYGQTRSYEDVALAVGAKTSHRAVARANGMNRLAIVVPCHRVLKKDGGLAGYGGGLWRKQFLLDLERTRETGQSFI